MTLRCTKRTAWRPFNSGSGSGAGGKDERKIIKGGGNVGLIGVAAENVKPPLQCVWQPRCVVNIAQVRTYL